MTNPKGYKPKNHREKFPLSVEEQREMIEIAAPREKALIVFILSTGSHPSVLSEKKYNLTWTDKYFSWNRPKTLKKVRGIWSKAMKDGELFKEFRRLKNKTPGYYWQLINDLGKKIGVRGICPLQLRHTHFVNRARLGHNPFDISFGSATSLQTVYNFYMIGMGESKQISQEDRGWLQWLMEP